MTHDFLKSNQRLTNSKNFIEQFSMQIQKIMELKEKKIVEGQRELDDLLTKHLEDLRVLCSQIIEQFNEQKRVILRRFDHSIIPIATIILDSLIKDAEHLKMMFYAKLDRLDLVTIDEWQNEVLLWEALYLQWSDRKSLIVKILKNIAAHANYLIDRDIQIVKDYQTQSLKGVSKESHSLGDLEKRLAKAVEGPLKELIALRNQPKDYFSIQQVSEWMIKVHAERENYFDQLLMKIDYVMKDVVYVEDIEDWTLFLEVEGEVVFMETEFDQINEDLSQMRFMEESDRQFILGRLEGLLDHLDHLSQNLLPISLKKRIHSLKERVSYSLSQYLG